MNEALFYEKLDDKKVRCRLCPNYCLLDPGETGICQVRTNYEGKLLNETVNKISSINFDPIEKKPLYHFHPGKNILSIGSLGCNLKCSFCQNCEISQPKSMQHAWSRNYDAEEIGQMARSNPDNTGVAYTYNEPTVYYEYMLDIASRTKASGLKNVMVTNGFISPEPLKKLFPYIDAFNVDLKAFNNKFYKEQTGSSLPPVKRTMELVREAGKHLEVTYLLIPDLNDDREEFSSMLSWIKTTLGKETVLHISRFFPHYKLYKPVTPKQDLLDCYRIASSVLDHVYLGNIHTSVGHNTHCPDCGNTLITRNGYQTRIIGLNANGECTQCDAKLKPLVR